MQLWKLEIWQNHHLSATFCKKEAFCRPFIKSGTVISYCWHTKNEDMKVKASGVYSFGQWKQALALHEAFYDLLQKALNCFNHLIHTLTPINNELLSASAVNYSFSSAVEPHPLLLWLYSSDMQNTAKKKTHTWKLAYFLSTQPLHCLAVLHLPQSTSALNTQRSLACWVGLQQVTFGISGCICP